MTIKTHKGEAEKAPSLSSVVIPQDSSESAAQTWTREFPRKDGYFWMRFADPPSEAMIVEVTVMGNLRETGLVGDVRNRVDIDTCEFLGPIPLPPITQPTASASALSQDVPDESSLQHETKNAGSGACDNFTAMEARTGICKHCGVEDYFHGESKSSPPPDAGVVVNETAIEAAREVNKYINEQIGHVTSAFDDESSVPDFAAIISKHFPRTDLESILEEIRAPKRRQLVHSARQMFETRWAKYNDPHNEAWDFNDIDDKWERHAWSAYLDLVEVEKERDTLLSIIDSLQAEMKFLQNDLRLTRAGRDLAHKRTYEVQESAASNMKTLIVERVREKADEYERKARTTATAGLFGSMADLLHSLATELEAIEPKDLSGR